MCAFFPVAYKHINGTGEITFYLAQTGPPSYVSNMYVHVQYCLCMVIEKNQNESF